MTYMRATKRGNITTTDIQVGNRHYGRMKKSNWKNQTSKTEKGYGGISYISSDKKTQISISKWDYDASPNNWAFYVHSTEEARKGYPTQQLGITREKAMSLLKDYMRKH